MNRGMYGANNGVIGNIWGQKVSQSAKEGTHPLPQLDEDVYNLFNSWNFELPDNADDINNFIINLKCELGIQKLNDVFDCFYILASATQSQSLINWAQPGTYDLTIGNSSGLIFTALQGWRTTAFNVTGYLNTNFNPYNLVCNFNENVEVYNAANESATQSFYKYGGSMGIYVNNMYTAQASIFVYDMGSSYGANGIGNIMSILSHSSVGGQIQCYGGRITLTNEGNPAYSGSTPASQLAYNSPAFYSFVRNDAFSISYYSNTNLQTKYRNSTVATNMATSSCAGPIIFPGFNIATSVSGVTKNVNGSTMRQFAFVFIGSKSIDQTILYNNVNAYLTSIGAAAVNS